MTCPNRQVHFYVKSSIGLSCLSDSTHHNLTQTIPHRLVPIDLMKELMDILKLPAAIEVMHDLVADLPIEVTKFHLKPPSQVGKFPQQLNGFTPSLPRICHEILFL